MLYSSFFVDTLNVLITCFEKSNVLKNKKRTTVFMTYCYNITISVSPAFFFSGVGVFMTLIVDWVLVFLGVQEFPGYFPFQ